MTCYLMPVYDFNDFTIQFDTIYVSFIDKIVDGGFKMPACMN